ncbi:MarR family winged helix-turn-helix transcriptional regulator [Rhodococcus erythropolis]|uniref:MarR family winged helix-turn-helix transcriptional regulator n=1 Tax=Rhodococcus erythropolis TaxID=1833 RepID=UPI0012D47B04
MRTLRLSTLLENALAERLRPLKLTQADFYVITTLRTAGPAHESRPSDLADRLLLTTGGLSNLLRRLTARGLVEREQSLDDRRSTRVRLSDEGVTIADQCLKAWSDAQQHFFRGVPTPHRVEASGALARLLSDVDSWPAPGSDPSSWVGD